MDYEKMIIDVADLVHKYFLEIYKKENNGTRIKITKDKAWIGKHNTNKADLAKLSYFDLPDDWQHDRRSGSKVALDAVIKWAKSGKPADKKFIENVSEKIHKDWLKRNSDRAEEEHKLPYEKLSEKAKEKDRIFIRAAIKTYNDKL
jgi:hypothetical protein